MKFNTPPFLAVLTVMVTLLSLHSGAQSKTSKAAKKIYTAERANFLKIVNNPKTVAAATRGSYGVYSNYERKYNAKNNLCPPEAYSIPKKVALLSFYIEDNDYKTYSQTGSWRTTWSYKASAEKVNAVAQRIYEQCFDSLKAEYAKLGMDLQAPNEYLTTPESKKNYYEYPLPNLESRLSTFDLIGSGSATPESYRFFPYNSVVGAQGKHFAKEKMDFYSSLGFDAFVIIAIRLTASNNAISGVTATFNFKNPGWDASGLSGMIVGYAPFNTAVMTMNFDPILKGIFLKEEEEIINKKGKPDFKYVLVDVDPNVGKLVNYTAIRLANKAIVEIQKTPKKKKKK